jgi:hypothetical protein
MRLVAALYVQESGCYFNLEGVDPYDITRDARLYAGPHPVVAHPPCERWGRYWSGGPSAKVRRLKGDDGGCFAAALKSVRQWGGVLEHPKDSSAWAAFGLNKPPFAGGWVKADEVGGFTCCVHQGFYGHRAPKATWLYAKGVDLPDLRWGRAPSGVKLDLGYHTAEERAANKHLRQRASSLVERLSASERAATPVEFRDLLINIARTAKRQLELFAFESVTLTQREAK